jgi:hypothetical protein
MLSVANDLVARAARRVFIAEETALWTISVRGRVVGSLVSEAGVRRLSWFEGVGRRLADGVAPIDSFLDGDVDLLAEILSARLGAPVELQSLAV